MKKAVLIPLVSGLFLCLALLSACGTGQNTTTNTPTNNAEKSTPLTPASTIQAAKTPAPALIPTAAPTQPVTNNTTSSNTNNNQPAACTKTTNGCGTGSSSLTPYKGNGYNLDFPGSWVVTSDGNNGTIFSTPDKAASFHVFVGDSTSSVNPLQYEFGTISKLNCHAVPSGLPITQSNSGMTWNQAQYICDSAVAGGNKEEIGILTAIDTHNGKYYNIDYITRPDTFDNASQNFFGPMVASFKLAANLG